MLTNTINKLTLLLLMSASVQVMALPDDRNKPIHVSADSATRNDQSGITLYKGRVELAQGSMQITGSSVEIRQNDSGLRAIIAKGKPAKYQQKPAPDQETTYANGQVLEYNIKTQKLTITGQAKVTQGSDTFSGNKIVYDMRKSIVDAFSDSSSNGERVQMVIQPKPVELENESESSTDSISTPKAEQPTETEQEQPQ